MEDKDKFLRLKNKTSSHTGAQTWLVKFVDQVQ